MLEKARESRRIQVLRQVGHELLGPVLHTSRGLLVVLEKPNSTFSNTNMLLLLLRVYHIVHTRLQDEVDLGVKLVGPRLPVLR